MRNNNAICGEIPVKIWKNCGSILDILKNCINQSNETSNFPDCLKSDPLQKGWPSYKLNYRPVSIFPLLSKVYEKLIYNELYDFAESILNSIICGFWKAHSVQIAK